MLCCREIQASIRDSVKRLLDDQAKRLGLSSFYSSVDNEIRGINGSLFLFAGLRNNVDAIKSMEGIDIAWVEEAQTVSQSSLDILIPTIRKPESEIWFSWNPRHETDPVDAMFRKGEPPPNSIIRQINPEDNPWFPEVLAAEMAWDLRRDIDKYSHIWRGGYQKHSESRVFKNWRVGSSDEFQTTSRTVFYFGGDWGFASDPSVLVRVYFEGRTLFVDREAYAVGCDIDYTPFLFGGCEDLDLRKLNQQAWDSPGMAKWKHCKGIEGAKRWAIIADSSRPETISYMQRHGFERVQPAKKGAGSIEEGVEFLKKFDIVVHPDCQHSIDELSLYSYKIDKLTNAILPILEDKKNHVIDSLRYAVEAVRRAGVPLKDCAIAGRPRASVTSPAANVSRRSF